MSEPLYPVFLRLAGRRCLVAGGGRVGAAKAERLLEHGARVLVVSPELSPRLEALAAAGALEHRRRGFGAEDLEGCALAIAATGVPAVDAEVAREAQARGIPVSVAGDPALGSFTGGSSVRRGDLTIAVSTGGASPALARRLREELEERYGPEWADLTALLRDLRPALTAAEPDPAGRRRALGRLLATDVLERLATGDAAGARAVAGEALLGAHAGVARWG